MLHPRFLALILAYFEYTKYIFHMYFYILNIIDIIIDIYKI